MWYTCRVPCSCGKVYAGEGKSLAGYTSINTRHQPKEKENKESSIAQFVGAKQHCPVWDETSIVEQVKEVDILQIKETSILHFVA